MSYPDDITFTVTCTMRRRWAEQFVSMLRHMQKLGSWGSSRDVTLCADGDGDFRPRFSFVGTEGISDVRPLKDINGDTYWDAG